MNHEEAKIQASLVQVCNSLDWCYLFMVKNDGAKSQAQAMRDKAMGLRSGVSDMILMTRWGESVFIEVKALTGRLSKPQEEFKKRCEMWGHRYFVVRSQDEFIALLDTIKKP